MSAGSAAILRGSIRSGAQRGWRQAVDGQPCSPQTPSPRLLVHTTFLLCINVSNM